MNKLAAKGMFFLPLETHTKVWVLGDKDITFTVDRFTFTTFV